VVAALAAVATLSGASATDATPKQRPPARAPEAAHQLPQLPLTPEMLSQGAPPGAKVLPGKPVHVAHPAPATKPVISGLAANGVPNIALNGYRLAAARLASAEPSCGIQWPLLAAIGRVESNHGRYGGALLYPDGTSLPRIIGIALDGSSSAYIGDTDGGRLDGDTRYDQAVGPMQFIPSTWASWGIDGNGDGIANPFNIDDAALAAARYLCASGGDLHSRAGQVAAVLAYNHSDQYLAQVLALAAAYAQGVPVDDLPISGPTTGGLPPADPWSGLPVNPALPPSGASGASTPAGAPAAAQPGSRAGAGAPNRPGSPAAGPGRPTSGSTPTSAPTSGQPHDPGSPATPTPTPSGTGSSSAPPTPPPNPLQTVVNGVLCTLKLLGLPVCPTSAPT
jgi:membrane-bound lytic murein transglycosylase B